MKTAAITPAFGELLQAPTDVQTAALEHARKIYVAGNTLPERWHGRRHFVIVETGFGLGHNFLATWDAWQRDAQRCEHLCYLAIEQQPPRLDDLRHAHRQSTLPHLAAALIQAWPALTPNVHTLDFEAGRVTLLLALGPVAALLPALRAPADAFFLSGIAAPMSNAALVPLRVLKALGRMAAPGATLATWIAEPVLREGLRTAGFEVLPACGAGGEIGAVGKVDSGGTRAVHRPRLHQPKGAAAATAPRAGTAVVVGAGLAGAAVARALAAQGLQVTVLESGAEPAGQASGNAVGLFHGTVHADDGRHARLHRAAALLAQRTYAQAIAAGVPGQQAGLLRLEQRAGGLPAMQSLIARQGWPADYVQALSAAAASQRAGVQLSTPAWFYPGGGWISPPQWVRFALNTPAVQLQLRCEVHAVQRGGAQWQALGGQGQILAQGDVMVLANAQSAAALVQRLGHAAWPLASTRGQVTRLPRPPGVILKLPLTGEGYAVQLTDGKHGPGIDDGSLWFGATSAPGDPVADELPPVTTDDHLHNLQRLQRLMGLVAPVGAWGPDDAPPSITSAPPLQGRAAWRLNTNDRLPIAGQMPLLHMLAGQRQDQARLLPREPGLFVLTALGARGLTTAPLLAQLLAALAVGAPWPLEQDLADAVDPARWRVRAARKAGAEGA